MVVMERGSDIHVLTEPSITTASMAALVKGPNENLKLRKKGAGHDGKLDLSVAGHEGRGCAVFGIDEVDVGRLAPRRIDREEDHRLLKKFG